ADDRGKALEQERTASATELEKFDSVVMEGLFEGIPLEVVKKEIVFDRTQRDLDFVIEQVFGKPLSDLDQLRADLEGPDADKKAEAERTIAASLYLTPLEF